MSLDVLVVNPLIALIAGILILLMPRLLNYVVAIYLIVIGVLGLAHHFVVSIGNWSAIGNALLVRKTWNHPI